MDDEWTTAGEIVDETRLARLRTLLEDESDLVVEHRFYRGARAPYRFVVSSFDELAKYLSSSTSPGDSFYFWSFERCCPTGASVLHGKIPDAAGRVPSGGAY